MRTKKCVHLPVSHRSDATIVDRNNSIIAHQYYHRRMQITAMLRRYSWWQLRSRTVYHQYFLSFVNIINRVYISACDSHGLCLNDNCRHVAGTRCFCCNSTDLCNNDMSSSTTTIDAIRSSTSFSSISMPTIASSTSSTSTLTSMTMIILVVAVSSRQWSLYKHDNDVISLALPTKMKFTNYFATI